jgi:hypothetical protein
VILPGGERGKGDRIRRHGASRAPAPTAGNRCKQTIRCSLDEVPFVPTFVGVHRWLKVILFFLSAAVGEWGYADFHCPPPIGGSPKLAARSAEERLVFIQKHIDRDAHRARIWAWTWAGVYSALATLNFGLTFSEDHGTRLEGYVGGGSSLLGLSILGLLPLKVMRDQHRLKAQISRGGDRCELLAEAERLLARDAKSEAFGKSPLVWGGTFIYSLGLGFLLGPGLGRWQAAVISASTGTVIGELQVITQPDALPKISRRYLSGDLSENDEKQKVGWGAAPIWSSTEVGLAVKVSF